MTAPVDLGHLSCCFDWFCRESIAIWTVDSCALICTTYLSTTGDSGCSADGYTDTGNLDLLSTGVVVPSPNKHIILVLGL